MKPPPTDRACYMSYRNVCDCTVDGHDNGEWPGRSIARLPYIQHHIGHFAGALIGLVGAIDEGLCVWHVGSLLGGVVGLSIDADCRSGHHQCCEHTQSEFHCDERVLIEQQQQLDLRAPKQPIHSSQHCLDISTGRLRPCRAHSGHNAPRPASSCRHLPPVLWSSRSGSPAQNQWTLAPSVQVSAVWLNSSARWTRPWVCTAEKDCQPTAQRYVSG